MTYTTLGILAHVDAGKTTLSESMLYLSGKIRKLGRVDHRDTFLDTDEMERKRGITIFSKQARMQLGDREVTLLDTPGHVDFSAEMERTLQVLDAAILVISGADGVQGHTRTLWKLLQRYQVPTFLFVNKMDQEGADAEKLLADLRERLSDAIVDFSIPAVDPDSCLSADPDSSPTADPDGSPTADPDAVSAQSVSCVQTSAMRAGVSVQVAEEKEADRESFYDALAMTDEAAMEEFLEEACISDATICRLIRERKVFPCFFGSALKMQGVEEFMKGLKMYLPSYSMQDLPTQEVAPEVASDRTRETHQECNRKTCSKGPSGAVSEVNRQASTGYPSRDKSKRKEQLHDSERYPSASSEKKIYTDSLIPKVEDRFSARVFKITHDSQGGRLTHVKILSGKLCVKDMIGEEKVNQIRLYHGDKFEAVQEVQAGMICALTGISQAKTGDGLGAAKTAKAPALEPVLHYRVNYPAEIDAHRMLTILRELEEEDPMLRILWEEELGEIQAQLMGEVQMEILRGLVKERFGVDISFDAGNIVYKETIQNTVEGVGHYEPLKHYSEVHLILEPRERGAGMAFATDVSEDVLDKNWQRLIYTHMVEKEHRGVLTGAALTDIKMTLVAGRAHLKHTEGGDFRQSTYRAIRQGLMQAESILLEPWYDFALEIPSDCVGRAMTDIQRMSGSFSAPETVGESSFITGSAPVACMRDYMKEVVNYTKGRGSLTCTFKGYEECHNAPAVIAETAYDPERDQDNPTGSVFCSHGAGYVVPWNEVFEHMHIESQLERYLAATSDPAERDADLSEAVKEQEKRAERAASRRYAEGAKQDKELEEIFIRTYGKYEQRRVPTTKTYTVQERKEKKKKDALKEYLLVDGYNVIHAWEELRELSAENGAAARGRLMDILSNYAGFKKCKAILVFDAYQVEGETLEVIKYHNIHVVFTKEAETADQYIEKVVHEIGRKYHVTVVTSDGTEQVVIRGQGASLMSSREFEEEYHLVQKLIREEADARRTESGKRYLFDDTEKEFAERMDEIRLGKRTIED